MAVVLGGGFIAVVMMLYGTVANVLQIIGLDITDDPLVSSKEGEKTENGSKEG